jgi:hypothetical protein
MKRSTFVFAIVLIALAVGGWFWFVITSDTPRSASPQPSSSKPVAAPQKPKPAPEVARPAPPPPEPPPRDRRAIDPEIQKLADRLTDHAQTPLNDLEIVNEFFTMYLKNFSDLSVGSNEDLTAILTGSNPMQGVLFPADSPMIMNGQIVDRWGSPYWLHPNSGANVEIRSAGPDKSLFTPDDVIFNASPGGLGATPTPGETL